MPYTDVSIGYFDKLWEVLAMKELKLPRLISDGMILQQKKKIHIW